AGVAREDVDVEVPDLLPGGLLVVLAGRRPRAGGGLLESQGGPAGRCIDTAERRGGDVVQTVEVLVRGGGTLRGPAVPPSRRHECGRTVPGPHDVAPAVVFGLSARDDRTEGAGIRLDGDAEDTNRGRAPARRRTRTRVRALPRRRKQPRLPRLLRAPRGA